MQKIKHFLFPKPHINYLLFLVFFICSIIKQIIFKDIKDKDNLAIPIFKLYIYDIGDFFSLIPYLIIKRKSKSKITIEEIEEREKRKKSQEDINYIFNDSTKNEFKKNMSYIINCFYILNFNLFKCFKVIKIKK